MISSAPPVLSKACMLASRRHSRATDVAMDYSNVLLARKAMRVARSPTIRTKAQETRSCSLSSFHQQQHNPCSSIAACMTLSSKVQHHVASPSSTTTKTEVASGSATLRKKKRSMKSHRRTRTPTSPRSTTFDMTPLFLAATEVVAINIDDAFPSIEWPSIEWCEDGDDVSFSQSCPMPVVSTGVSPPTKPSRCNRGLLRSTKFASQLNCLTAC